MLPRSRTNDVIYLNPQTHADRVLGLNLLEITEPRHKTLVVSSLISIFKNIWPDAWGPRSEFILSNAAFALMAQRKAGTLVALQRLLTDATYRKELAARVADPAVRWFFDLYDWQWTRSFREEATAPLLNKVNKFVASPLLRPVLGQHTSSFDFRRLLDDRQILICDLSKGNLGADITSLIGSIVVTKLALPALSRQDTPEEQRAPHYLYADEVQTFMYGIDLPTILAESRKYRLALIMATQALSLLPTTTQAAVLGNCATIAAFRVSGLDAEILEQEFAAALPARELQNLDDYALYLRTLVEGHTAGPYLLYTLPPSPRTGQETTTDRIIAASLQRYGRPRGDVEAKLKIFLATPSHHLRKGAAQTTKKIAA